MRPPVHRSKLLHSDQALRRAIQPDGVEQGASEAGQINGHDVAVQQRHTFPEVEDVLAEGMDVRIAGAAVAA
jgi:hypothetical protein